jgi:hypothetical protein
MWFIPLTITLKMTKTRKSWSLMFRVQVIF